MLTLKFALFLAMEVFVVSVVVGAVIVGLYDVVRRKVRHNRVVDQLPKTS